MLRLEVSVARKWIDETGRWILGQCWLPLYIGTLVLASFGGGELLAIAISKIIPLIFLLSLACPCLCNADIKSEHAHNRHTRGERERECKVTT